MRLRGGLEAIRGNGRRPCETLLESAWMPSGRLPTGGNRHQPGSIEKSRERNRETHLVQSLELNADGRVQDGRRMPPGWSLDGRRMPPGWSLDGRRMPPGWSLDGHRMPSGWSPDAFPLGLGSVEGRRWTWPGYRQEAPGQMLRCRLVPARIDS
jgi:hypothetical protein